MVNRSKNRLGACLIRLRFLRPCQGTSEHEAIYKDFCQETGLPVLSERLQYPSFGRSISQKSVGSIQRLYKTAKGILSKENMPKSVAEFAKICYSPQGKVLKELSSISYEQAKTINPLFNDRVIRFWYDHHNKGIKEQLDTTKSLETQARQAHLLRNKYKIQARELMLDRAKAKELNEGKERIKPFEYYFNKYKEDGLSDDDVYRIIIDASKRTRPTINSKYGVN